MKDTKQKVYDHGTGVIHGALCKECQHDKTCKDTRCPVYKYRQAIRE